MAEIFRLQWRGLLEAVYLKTIKKKGPCASVSRSISWYNKELHHLTSGSKLQSAASEMWQCILIHFGVRPLKVLKSNLRRNKRPTENTRQQMILRSSLDYTPPKEAGSWLEGREKMISPWSEGKRICGKRIYCRKQTPSIHRHIYRDCGVYYIIWDAKYS